MANQYNRMTISGGLPGGERWSTSMHYKRVLPSLPDEWISDYEDLLSQCNNVKDILADMETNNPLRQLLSTAGTVDTIRWEYRDGQNLMQVAEINGAFLTGTGNMTKVFQTAIVFSARTGRPGRSYRGRNYWPALGASISTSTGRLSGPSTTGAATAWANFIKACGVRGGANFDLFPQVYSPKMDEVTTVTTIECGDVLDTQRRRRDSLVEAIASVEVPY